MYKTVHRQIHRPKHGTEGWLLSYYEALITCRCEVSELQKLWLPMSLWHRVEWEQRSATEAQLHCSSWTRWLLGSSFKLIASLMSAFHYFSSNSNMLSALLATPQQDYVDPERCHQNICNTEIRTVTSEVVVTGKTTLGFDWFKVMAKVSFASRQPCCVEFE